MEDCKRWLSPQEVTKRYGISVSTLAKSRMLMNGSETSTELRIPFSKFGKYIKYDVLDIEEFLSLHKKV